MFKKFSSALLIVLGVFITSIHAQESGFYQHDGDPIGINAANTGSFDDPFRIVLNYTEFNSNFLNDNLFTVSYDQPLYIETLKFGIGIIASHDEISDRFITRDRVGLSLSWHFGDFSFGLQPTYGFISPNVDFEVTPGQYNPGTGTFNTATNPGAISPSRESFEENQGYFELNAGLAWRKQILNHSLNIGASAFHLNAPDLAYGDDPSKVAQRYLLHASDDIQVTKRLHIIPSLISYSNLVFSEISLGGNLEYEMDSGDDPFNKSVFVGVYSKNNLPQMSALMFTAGLKYRNLHLGFSFDYNITESDQYIPVRGPFEFVVIYKGIHKVSPPCFRF